MRRNGMSSEERRLLAEALADALYSKMQVQARLEEAELNFATIADAMKFQVLQSFFDKWLENTDRSLLELAREHGADIPIQEWEVEDDYSEDPT